MIKEAIVKIVRKEEFHYYTPSHFEGVTFYYKKVYVFGKLHHYESTYEGNHYRFDTFKNMKALFAFALTHQFNCDPYEVAYYI